MASPADADTLSSLARATDPADGGQPAKKRRTGPSARGVANLTPEQLARKRANDREAQRAIRERTKSQIDRLNERIRELESQQPYNDLQVVLREKEAIQAENAEIRRRLETVLTTIQPILRASSGLNELAAAAERSPLPVAIPHHQLHRDAPAQPLDTRAFHPLQELVAVSPSNGVNSPIDTEGGPQWLPAGEAPTSHVRRYSNNAAQFEQPRSASIQDVTFDERMGVDFLLDNAQRRAVDPNLPPPQQPSPSTGSSNISGQHAPVLAAHLTLPRNISASCPLDVLLLEFLQDRQARAVEGTPMKTLVGPLYPNFTSLVYPDRAVNAHPLSKLFTDILRTFPDICGMPEQVATVYIMFLIMRWQIEPTQENYDRLPHWVTPRASQLFTSHPCWFDHVPWPKLRDKLITTQPFISFENFFIPFTTTMSLNWPYEYRDVLLPASKIHPSALSTTSSIPVSSSFLNHVGASSPSAPPTPQPAAGTPTSASLGSLPKEDDQWLINPAFESHLRDLNNWSLGPAFRSAFPHFAGCVKIKEGR